MRQAKQQLHHVTRLVMVDINSVLILSFNCLLGYGRQIYDDN